MNKKIILIMFASLSSLFLEAVHECGYQLPIGIDIYSNRVIGKIFTQIKYNDGSEKTGIFCVERSYEGSIIADRFINFLEKQKNIKNVILHVYDCDNKLNLNLIKSIINCCLGIIGLDKQQIKIITTINY